MGTASSAFTGLRWGGVHQDHCLGCYITHSETELQESGKELEQDKTRERTDEELTVVCPVCREPLTYNFDQPLFNPAPSFPKPLQEGAIRPSPSCTRG
ncbi:E3 ubiquitin-protein ligase RNF25-like isoform X2 [Oncorhynchus clarkii lewisi]|uniref:E3 ubiquitin-protein ligase RNF25-like isoform X2 n=1 Tax=Oncorhynchus clarkii lewisi TaxID=490388 RepID=UPI0039B83CC3